ncbi:MAG: N-acetylglucosamine-6-phosphate deacetylase [Acidobacteriota bacterium]
MTDTIVLAGAAIVLPDRVLDTGSLVIAGGHIAEIVPREVPPSPGDRHVLLRGHVIVPGFVDLHMHGLEGVDTLDDGGAIAALAERAPRYGVTAFAPTTVACSPAALRTVLGAIRDARCSPRPARARVLAAHLESNFINPEYRGAQPARCLRLPFAPAPAAGSGENWFSGQDILDAIDEAGPDVGIVTMAPEIDGGLDLLRRFARAGVIVSLGHSGASFDVGAEAIRAGARQATHLFNRMAPVAHREPGLAGAVLESSEIAAELVCDGFHVHPGMLRVAIAAKGRDRVMAITDSSAGAGLPPGSTTMLGGRRIRVTGQATFLEDGTLAGSSATMDRVFRVLVSEVGLSLVDAVHLCATTPARELGLHGHGLIAVGAAADLAVLDSRYGVAETIIGGLPSLGRL